VQRLRDADPPVRTAAAIAVGILQIKGAVPGLQTMFDTDAPAQKMFAAVALKQLGQTSPDAYLATLLASPVPDLRLIAARAYLSAKSPQWDTLVRALLSDRNEVNRIHAAEVMACCDKNAARATLVTVLGSANPAVRMEAARVLEDKDLADVGVARRLLGDPFDGVRLHGAGAVLKLLKTSAAPGRGGVGTVGPRG
jgi:HEAT repeat protein